MKYRLIINVESVVDSNFVAAAMRANGVDFVSDHTFMCDMDNYEMAKEVAKLFTKKANINIVDTKDKNSPHILYSNHQED